jgi:hypothetical protein
VAFYAIGEAHEGMTWLTTPLILPIFES